MFRLRRRRLPLLAPLAFACAAQAYAQAASASSGNSSASFKLGYFGSSNKQQDLQQSAMALMNVPTSHHASIGLSQMTSYAPPSECFNCLLPSFTCTQFGQCNEYDGQCICPDGFGGLDCSKPLDGSLADGKERYPRDGNEAQCKEGWTGLNCNGMSSSQLPFARLLRAYDRDLVLSVPNGRCLQTACARR